MKLPTFQSSRFILQGLRLSTGTEQMLRGGRDIFPSMAKAFADAGTKRIVVIGYGSQAPAQAMNLRDSLKAAGSEASVRVALRANSTSRPKARLAGFIEGAGTLGTPEELVPRADLVLFLVSDQAQTATWKEITGLMKPGATLGFSHGFLPFWLNKTGQVLRNDINVILVAPKGVGSSVRSLYLQGIETNGAGINASVAVEQDVTGHALDVALAWAVGIGSPYVFFTTAEDELKSDLTGERAGLLGGHWGMVEALYERLLPGEGFAWCFLRSAKALSQAVPEIIGERGLLGLYQSLDEAGRFAFRDGYLRAYGPCSQIVADIYRNVADGDEVESVIERTARIAGEPLEKIEAAPMWAHAKELGLHGERVMMDDHVAFAAGAYAAMLFAGMELLVNEGHSMSEGGNEQVIEAVDSLDPIADEKGVGAMVDFCSTTAAIGARKWGPVFREGLGKAFRDGPVQDDEAFDRFLESPLHGDLAKLFEFRPPVKLFIGAADRSSGASS